jgi:hypothetical protein
MAMRFPVVLAAALVVAGCGSSGDSGGNPASSGEATTAAGPRVEKCVELFFARATSNALTESEIRRYVEGTYCSPFERKGWVYEDGTLSIAAYLFLARGGSEECASEAEGDTVPCGEPPGEGPVVLDCAVLHVVRREEVQRYVRELERHREVSCDDGTPLERLGAVS